MLRHLDHPQRLSCNPLVRTEFAGVTPAAGAVRVRLAVDAAVEKLPERRRAIVRRCDLQGEAHSAVIRDLGISERHFYRERRAALEAIASEVCAPRHCSGVEVRSYDSKSERLAFQFDFAEAARQAGDGTRAASLLGDARTAELDDVDRAQLECRLAELLCESGSMERAFEHLRSACESLHGPSPQTSGAASLLAWRSGRVEAAVALADRVIAGQQRTPARTRTRFETRAFSIALLVKSEIEVAQGRWRSGRRYALMARDAAVPGGTEFGALRARAALAAAFACMFEPAQLNDAAVELESGYRSAIASGLMLEALLAKLHLGVIHRFRDAPKQSAGAIEGLVTIADRMLSPEQYAVVCLELANAYLHCGYPGKALTIVDEVRRRQPRLSDKFPFADLLSAGAYLSQGEYRRARDLSASVCGTMSALGIITSVGESLRIQAEANLALGELRIAKDLIAAAITELERGGHPHTIAKTHASAARITGNRKHALAARELLNALRAR